MKKLIASVGTGLMALAMPAIVFAQDKVQQTDLTNLRNLINPIHPTSSTTLNFFEVVVSVLNFVILIAAVLAIFYLIWAGIQYITASTDEEKAKKARAGIYNAVIGIVVIVLSFVIIQYVTNIARGTFDNQQNNGGGGLNLPG